MCIYTYVQHTYSTICLSIDLYIYIDISQCRKLIQPFPAKNVSILSLFGRGELPAFSFGRYRFTHHVATLGPAKPSNLNLSKQITIDD